MLEAINLTKIFPHKGRIIIKRKDITKGVLALDQVNLKVDKGQLFGLLGPNGAGKTTLVKIFCGLILPTKGAAMVNGLDVAKERSRVIENLGVMLPEMRGFY